MSGLLVWIPTITPFVLYLLLPVILIFIHFLLIWPFYLSCIFQDTFWVLIFTNISLCCSHGSTGLREERTRGSCMHFLLPKSPSCYLIKWLCLGSWMGTVVLTLSPPSWSTEVSPLTWMPAGLLPNSWNVMSMRLPFWTLTSLCVCRRPVAIHSLCCATEVMSPWAEGPVCVSLTLSSSCPWSLERFFASWNFSFCSPTHLLGSGGRNILASEYIFSVHFPKLFCLAQGPWAQAEAQGEGDGSPLSQNGSLFLSWPPPHSPVEGTFTHCGDRDPVQPSSPLETSLQLRTSILDMVDLISCSGSSPIN